MKIDGQPFELQIVGQDGKIVEHRAEGYVGLAHKEQYKLRIANTANRRVAVELVIDGTPFEKRLVIAANHVADIETIPDTGKKLTAFLDNSDEGRQALLGHVSDENLGLISATFVLEKPAPPRFAVLRMAPSCSMLPDLGGQTRGTAMGTGLSGFSNQRFQQTSFTNDPDFAPVTLHLRLHNDESRKIGVDASPIPGRQTSTPIPAPVPRPK